VKIHYAVLCAALLLATLSLSFLADGLLVYYTGNMPALRNQAR
jgi:hypothetical protein